MPALNLSTILLHRKSSKGNAEVVRGHHQTGNLPKSMRLNKKTRGMAAISVSHINKFSHPSTLSAPLAKSKLS